MANNGLKIEKQVLNLAKSNQKSTAFPDELFENFRKTNEEYYKKSIPLKMGKDDVTLSDEEAKNLADEKLKDYFNDQMQKIDLNFNEKQQKIYEKTQKTQNSFDDSLQNMNTSFKNDKRKLDIKAIDSGWKNSSIYQNLQKNLANDYNANLQNLKMDYDEKMSNLMFQKNVLETEKQEALKNFNISYAQKLSKKIEEVTKEFNNQNKTLQTYFATNLEQLDKDLKQEKATQLLEYLKNYTKTEAKNFLSRNQKYLTDELGSVVFETVSSWVNR